jgi:hypothetical protein
MESSSLDIKWSSCGWFGVMYLGIRVCTMARLNVALGGFAGREVSLASYRVIKPIVGGIIFGLKT